MATPHVVTAAVELFVGTLTAMATLLGEMVAATPNAATATATEILPVDN